MLDKRAFFDLPSLVTGLALVKDYLLAADVHQGLYFMRYSDAARVIEFMAKDFDAADVAAAGIVVNEPKLHFVAADAAGSLRMMEYYGKDRGVGVGAAGRGKTGSVGSKGGAGVRGLGGAREGGGASRHATHGALRLAP